MNLKNILFNTEKRTVIFLVISLLALLLSFVNITLYGVNFAWIAIILCGIPIIKDAVVGLVTEFDIKADVLVAMALIASIIIGEIFAAGEIAFIMAIGGLLEEYTVARSKAGIEKLIQLTPRTARSIKDGNEEIIDAKDVKIGDLIKILPGETIPADGEIVDGETSVDQSIMTGEPIPVDKTVDDEVFSGTVNQFGSIIVKSTKLGKDSSLNRMISLVESADAGKSKIVRLTDKWATWIVVIALGLAILTWFLTGEIIRSVTILVVFCPCALVLATPTAIVAAIGNLTKVGILVKEGDALERLSKVKKIIFDKTGTLTYGKPEVTDIILYEDHDKEKLLQIIASLENKSEHPLGKSIVNYYNNHENERNQGVYISKLLHVIDFEMIIGKGIKGKVDGKEVLAGNVELFKDNNISIPRTWQNEKLSDFNEEGCIIIYLAIESEFMGALILNDVLRKDAKEVINSIENSQLEPILVTGDNEKPAKHMAKQLGISNISYNSLPETKMNIINDYQKNNEKVAMIGDGVNDAPSLKKAFVGIAMGGIGSDIAIDAADIVLISDDIKFIPHLLGISKKTMKTININIMISLLLNFIAIILAILGILNPITGALVHNIGSVLVVIYSSLLLMWK
ncbi:putative copper-importing P-type ATPase A [Methanobrevibacter cuticularis]|uniref:Putative copper-importing P-type ATPase A n=1 Tax=Methanobrevibacter cuticularis TaxID=47311 RepID=A0A166DFU7_9EURY|nr:cation-translocating P-type ATPase [Methanobrevibacter cuticularis]KZX15559.1 putative copper-importing P-type ATPase A [Methanobrevibacter cuticularis]